MPDLPYDTQPNTVNPAETNQDPAYNALRDLAPEGVAKDSINEITSRLNDYQQKSALVDANEQAGANFVNDISGWKQGMESAVRNDPNFVHTAMDVTVPFIQGITASIPGDPMHADTLIRDMHHDLATLSVYTAAERNGAQARSLLGNDRIAGQLSEDERGVLDRYIGHQEDARARDAAVQRVQAQTAQAAEVNDRTLGWAALLDPEGAIPPSFHASVLADPNIEPETKGHLGDLASKLMVQGDNPTSNSFLLTNMVKQIANGEAPSTDQLMQMVTSGQLTTQDMMHLSSRGLSAMTPQAKTEAAQLSQTLDAAQRYLVGPNNENGVAGANAYGRFTGWLMRQYQHAGPGSLDPRSDNWIFEDTTSNKGSNFLDRFYPSGDDVLSDLNTPSMRDQPKIDLKDIFAGTRPPVGDRVQTVPPVIPVAPGWRGPRDYNNQQLRDIEHDRLGIRPRSQES